MLDSEAGIRLVSELERSRALGAIRIDQVDGDGGAGSLGQLTLYRGPLRSLAAIDAPRLRDQVDVHAAAKARGDHMPLLVTIPGRLGAALLPAAIPHFWEARRAGYKDEPLGSDVKSVDQSAEVNADDLVAALAFIGGSPLRGDLRCCLRRCCVLAAAEGRSLICGLGVDRNRNLIVFPSRASQLG